VIVVVNVCYYVKHPYLCNINTRWKQKMPESETFLLTSKNNQRMETPVFYFDEKETFRTIDLDLLEKSKYLLNPDRTPPPTRPVESFELIRNVNDILDSNNVVYSLQPIIVQRKGSELLLDKNQRATIPITEIPIDAWRFERILMQWVFPHESNLKPGITVAFHERGIDMAFGLFNSFCMNHCVFGDQWYTTYNTKLAQKRMYQDMVNGLVAWLHNFDQVLSLDRARVQLMLDTTFGQSMIEDTMDMIAGKLYRKARAQAKGKGIAPLDISEVGLFVDNMMPILENINSKNLSLWDIYNVGTALMKAERMPIDSLNMNNVLWGEFVMDTFIPDHQEKALQIVGSN